MKKLSLDSKRYIRAGIFLLCVISISKVAFAQPEHKFSIEDKIMQEKQTESAVVNALAPESVFLKTETTEALFRQMKLLARLMYESTVKELKKPTTSNEELPKAQRPHRVLGASRQLTQRNESEKVDPVIEQLKNRSKGKVNQTQVRRISLGNFKPQMINDFSNQLITHDGFQGTINALSYERIEGRGVRFRYTEIPEEMIGHFWYFRSNDLRGKTIRIYYSGIVPHEITFLVAHSYWSTKAIYRFRLEDSPETKVLSFQIPNRFPFKDVSIFEFRIEKSRAGRPYGDFLVEKVEILEGGDDSTLIGTRSQPKPFVFGGPYLQPNVWGGEVLTS